jgi:hypothetical protein
MDNRAAFDNAWQWTLLYPQDAEAHAFLGHLAMFAGEYDLALRENDLALALDSTYAGSLYSNSGFAHALAGRPNEALAFFRKSKGLRSSYLALDGYIAQAYWIRADLDSAETAFRSILREAPPLRRVKTHAHLAALYHSQGRLQEALLELDAGRQASREAGRPEDEAYLQYLRGEIEAERGHMDEYLAAMDDAVRLSPSPFFEVALAGGSLARHGYPRESRDALARLQAAESLDPHFVRRRPSMEHYVRGEAALAARDPESAADHFGRVEELRRGDPFYLLARRGLGESYAQRSDPTAARVYRDLLDRRGEVCMAFLSSDRDGGLWVGKLWPEVHEALGSWYLGRRDSSNALLQFNAALEYWHRADRAFLRARPLREHVSSLADAEAAEVH